MFRHQTQTWYYTTVSLCRHAHLNLYASLIDGTYYPTSHEMQLQNNIISLRGCSNLLDTSQPKHLSCLCVNLSIKLAQQSPVLLQLQSMPNPSSDRTTRLLAPDHQRSRTKKQQITFPRLLRVCSAPLDPKHPCMFLLFFVRKVCASKIDLVHGQQSNSRVLLSSRNPARGSKGWWWG